MAHKIIMIMGVQRSGTSPLFYSLAEYGSITAYHESANDPIYDNFFLRPEPEIRPILREAPGVVLLKPISETFRRTIEAVFAEFADYDLHIVWIYRDPVNVLYSQERRGWISLKEELSEQARHWSRRNQMLLDCLTTHADRLTVVRFEDLCADPTILADLGLRLGIPTQSVLQADSGAGRASLPSEAREAIERETGAVLARLDAVRTFKPKLYTTGETSEVAENALPGSLERQAAGPSARGLGRLRNAAPVRWLTQRLGRVEAPEERSVAPPKQGGDSLVHAVTDRLLLGQQTRVAFKGEGAVLADPDIFAPEFQSDPHSHYRRWRRQGALRRLPQSDSWLVLSYDDIIHILNDPAVFSPSIQDADQEAETSEKAGDLQKRDRMRRLLAPYFTADQVQNRTKMIVQRARLFLEALIGREAFDLINEFSLPLVSLLGCEWLGVKTEKLDVFYRSMRAGPTWEKLQAAMTGTGLLAELHTGGKISTRELLEWYCFIYSGPVAVSDFIANAIYILLEQPVWLEQARAQPDVIPALVEELLRLAPPVLHVRRRVLKAVNIAGIELPAGALLYLAIASANRDPDKFERPAELILHRSGPTHLSFGAGSHDCMGRHWGRVEAEILLRLLLVEYPPLRAVQPLNDIEFIGGPHIHLPREMHVSFAPTSV